MNHTIAFGVELAASRDEAVAQVTAALEQEMFGVLTRVDVDQVFASKLGVSFPPYTILGACNPSLAHAALSERTDVGLLLPCNVTIEETPPGTSIVRIGDPEVMMGLGGFDQVAAIEKVGAEAKARLKRVAAALADAR